jgi:hypothetical protein
MRRVIPKGRRFTAGHLIIRGDALAGVVEVGGDIENVNQAL